MILVVQNKASSTDPSKNLTYQFIWIKR